MMQPFSVPTSVTNTGSASILSKSVARQSLFSSVVRSVKCKSINGAESQHQNGKPATREMHIASTDSFDDYGNMPLNGSRRQATVHVIPPRTEAPRQLQRFQNGNLALSDEQSRAEIKAAKAELAITKQENQQRSMELAESEKKLRAKEAEVTLLRAAMTGRDINLRDAKMEVAEAQAALASKDEELQTVLQQLLSNAKERGDLRHRLLSIQKELGQARDELEEWTQQGFKLLKAAQLKESEVSEDVAEEKATRGFFSKKTMSSDQMTSLLEKLSKLSQTIADDAQADDNALTQIRG